ncbi:Na+-transporting methylmalonyl-CoA/oxaloacetate decarboxylase gamma subunit [Allocatelliglobosispora scoriae]|uniref:Na+-transporting methylmalonyl-CoA/oxaloacetate decarboxylase gamma subunit n=1 Tax=Allocatelliglobosispora scoriae TaxID=643052 RepID=A0A841BKG4_9ACTN|nr:hypothetical protein [Allocatelliglobosispora scoriae]MBB5867493.1 Na+-transporting methylmalonyl-CoA/oxaloacetate decarboxylase gamma subunit [Allocatelliglobosispora scoriae]
MILAVVLWFLGLGFLAVILWMLLLIYAIAWLRTLIFARVAASLGQDLAAHARAVADAIAKVVMSCPENCRGDLSVPTCNP